MQFNALVNGHTIIMDTPERGGGDDHGPHSKTFCPHGTERLHRYGCDYTLAQARKTTGRFKPEGLRGNIVYEMTGKDEDRQAALDAVRKELRQ